MLVNLNAAEKEFDQLLQELNQESARENHDLIQTTKNFHSQLRALGKELADPVQREQYTYFVRILGQYLFELTGEFFPLRLEPLNIDSDIAPQDKNQDSPTGEATIQSVKATLIACRRSDAMDRTPAATWPSVQVLVEQGTSHANAIQQVIGLACKAIAQDHPESIELITTHYLKGLSSNEIATAHHISRPTLYRKIQPGLQGLVSWINNYNQVTSNRPLSSLSPAQHLPVPRLPMVGNESVVSDIEKMLHDPFGPTVVVIAGVAGIGKTTLAQLVAQRAGPPAFAGILWASAKQVNFDPWFGAQQVVNGIPISINDIVHQMARQLEIQLHGQTQELIRAIHAKTQNAPHLIVIDNLETIADSHALADLIDLLAISNRIIITSRDYHPEMLPALLTRAYITLDELDLPMSIQLLRIAATYTGTPQLENSTDDELKQIYSITGGNPLALWLVAAQTRGLPWRIFIDLLDKNYHHELTGPALYDYIYRRSWNLLSNDAKTILFSMHRHSSGVTYDDLLKTSGLQPLNFHQSLNEVLRQMLITFDGQIYRIHRLTYTFLRVVIAGWWS